MLRCKLEIQSLEKPENTMIYLNKKNQIAQGAALISAAFLTLALQAQEYVMDPDWPKPLPENIEWGRSPT